MKKAFKRTAAMFAMLVLVAGGSLLVTAAPAQAIGSYNNAAIADKAMQYVGQWGGNACSEAGRTPVNGQCRMFVNCIVWMVSGHTQNTSTGGAGYFQSFLNAGAVEVTDYNALQKGDIVQKYVSENDLHTWIIVSRDADGYYWVVDSNSQYNEMVRHYKRTNFTGLSSTTRAFRMGTVSGGSGGWKLAFIKTKNTGGTVEVHQAPSPYTSFSSSTSSLSPVDASNGWFSMAGDKLVFIKTRNTGSGQVELHWRTASSGYTTGLSTSTWFSPVDQNNGWFSMVGTDLVFIKTHNTGSYRVEVHKISSANYNAPPYSSSATIISEADSNNGWFQMYGNDLVFIKTKNTGSGKVEVHIADGSCGNCRWKQNVATAFSSAEQNNGWFSLKDVVGNDGIPDLVYIKTKYVGSGQVELFVASGASNYSVVNVATPTAFSPADADNGWFSMNL